MAPFETAGSGCPSGLGSVAGGLPVYVPWPGKTLFETTTSFRVSPRNELPPGDLAAGIIVVPYPFSTRPQFLATAFSEIKAAWTQNLSLKAREGRVRFVLDASAEGFQHSDQRSDCIHRGLAELGVPANLAVVLTQERNYNADYAEYVQRNRLDSALRVLNYDLWIDRFHAQFEERGSKIFEWRLNGFKSREKVRGRKFVSLNMTLRRTKFLFLLSLIRDNLWREGHISFGGFYRKESKFHPDHERSRSIASIEEYLRRSTVFKDITEDVVGYLPALEAKGQLIFGDVERDPDTGLPRKSPLSAMLPQYDDSWFSVVTETEMRDRPSRITEKPFAPLVNFQPSILLGNPGALAQIRELGYLTFGHVLDESYDSIQDPAERFLAAYSEVLRLCRMGDEKLGQMEVELRDILVFNAKWGLTRLPKIYREVISTRLMDRIFADRRPSPN